MSDDGIISDRLRRFIAQYIHSVAQLEILLLLHTNPSQAWTAAAIARELRVEVSGAAEQLLLLATAGLAQNESPPGAPPAYHYHASTPEVQADTLALAQAYLIRRVTIIGLIFANPSDKIRSFSDAFRLRKEEPDA
jgi:hypothetical protein